uniref:Uncharacterized protein n=1 Tax=Arcella intermedia TaxID=1963864 RepID=A0A6B2LKB0_9EUKA
MKDGILDTFPAEFKIYAKDRDGNPITEGGDPFQVAVLGPNGEPCEVQINDNGDGTYNVVYQPDNAGPHTVHVTLDDKPIKDCPKTVNVKPGAWAKTSAIELYSFVVRTKDKRGNPLKEGGQPPQTVITAPTGEIIENQTTDNGDGAYVVQYALPVVEGRYTISCKIDDVDISGSPFEQTVQNI